MSHETAPGRTGRYLSNVIWSWAAVAVNTTLAFLLSPYIIRKIGDADFSTWMLALSLVEYYWLIDLGLRSATVKMSAECRALGRDWELEELLSTGATYSAIAGALLAAATMVVAPHLGKLFHIQHPAFPSLVMVVGVSWAVGMAFNPFGACADGFQRFDIFSRIWMMTNLVRSAGIVAVLRMGRGIFEMGLVLFGSQLLMYALIYITFRRLAPGLRLSWRKSSLPMFNRMARYGIHTFTASVATRLLNQSVPPLIAYFLPIRMLAYYAVPVRILEYGMEGIGRIGQVTMPNATDLMARGKKEELRNLGILANRYCLALFMPVTVFLAVYGFELYSLWIRPDFARESAYLLPVLLIGYTAVSGQFNSASILFGIARHKSYARFLLAETVAVLAGMMMVLPRFGLYGAAWVYSGFMALDRGVVVCVLASRELGIHPLAYAVRIYGPPLASGGLAAACLLALKASVLPGRRWSELIVAGLLMMLPYGLLTWRFSLSENHRRMVLGKIRNLLAPGKA